MFNTVSIGYYEAAEYLCLLLSLIALQIGLKKISKQLQ